MKQPKTQRFVCPRCGTEYLDRRDLSDSGKYCATCIREAVDDYATELAFVRDTRRQIEVIKAGLELRGGGLEHDGERVFTALQDADPDLLRQWVEDYVIYTGRDDYEAYLMETR